MRTSKLACFTVLALPAIALAQFKDENLLQKIPPGYKIAIQTRNGNAAITQMVPEGESIGGWTETIALASHQTALGV